ncbi:ABC transporter ATP-binding protein [uncultured Serinicoccus sp.]|uniref:ABC transporter ATP-binding protein n=1 Tax=uncultured Serinicoccus sp. TaxID=735514 RepID=UPI00262B498D|nr:ABC transporter ATP-binding protein [uncultured Serinicoccus sp.]
MSTQARSDTSAPVEVGQAMLSVRDLTVTFPSADGPIRAVNGMSFDVRPRERLGIVGESGSGKSVTAQALLGLTPRDHTTGSIVFEGEDLLTAPQDRLRALRGWDISYVFQDPLSALDPTRTVGHQVAQPLLLRRVPKKEAHRRAVEMLGEVGIPDPARRARNYPHQFSGGMRQRVMIAMALIGQPRLVIADEPTTALDVRVQAKIIDLLYRLTDEQGVAVVFITHDLGILAGLAERVIVMYAGRVMEECSTDELYYRSIHPYTLGLLESLPRISGPVPERLLTIGGGPPAPSRLPTGCPFHPRCQYVQPECRTTPPPLERPPGGEHASACLRAAWLAERPGELR